MELGGSYCWSIISPAGALSGVYVCEGGEEIQTDEEIETRKKQPIGATERGRSSQ